MSGTPVERYLAPIWHVQQGQNFDCGAATLLALAAFHAARASTPARQVSATAAGDPARVDGQPGDWTLPALEDPAVVLERWIKPGNLVGANWASDPVGLTRGLQKSVEEMGYQSRQPNWSPFTAPIDPDYYDTHQTYDPVNKGPTRGAEETVLARVAWQIFNRRIPAALGYASTAPGPHWVTAWGVAGELVPGKLIVHSLRITDPAPSSPPYSDLPVDSAQAICAFEKSPGYWCNQLMAVGNLAPPADDHPANQYVALVNLKPLATPSIAPVTQRNAMPVGLDPGKTQLADHYQPDCWKGRIRQHAEQNVTVRKQVWDRLDRGELAIGRPLPVWSEQRGHYEFLVPLLTAADGSHEQIELLLQVDSKGLISRIYGPDLGPFREFYAKTKLLDPGFQAAHPDMVQVKRGPPDAVHTQQLVFPDEQRPAGHAVPLFQSLAPGDDPDVLLDHEGEEVKF